MPELLIAGRWRDAADGATREIRCPADTARVVATVSEGTAQDAAEAVAAARRAFDHGPWPATPAPERAALLHRVADRLEADAEEVARLESLDTGKRMVESRLDMADVVSVFRHFAGLAQADAGRVVDTGMPDVVSRVVHEPVGVATLITPSIYAGLSAQWKQYLLWPMLVANLHAKGELEGFSLGKGKKKGIVYDIQDLSCKGMDASKV